MIVLAKMTALKQGSASCWIAKVSLEINGIPKGWVRSKLQKPGY
jgi:hypothetical protein